MKPRVLRASLDHGPYRRWIVLGGTSQSMTYFPTWEQAIAYALDQTKAQTRMREEWSSLYFSWRDKDPRAN